MFLFTKIVGLFVSPLSLCLEVLIIGLIMLWFTKKQRAGKIVISVGVVLLALLSYGGLSEPFLKPLEYRYPPLLKINILPEVRWIVVLGGGLIADPKQPANSQLTSDSLFRLVEGIRLHKSLPGTKLILSAGTAFDRVSGAEVMSNAASLLGVEKKEMVLESESKDTEDQAKLIKKIVGSEPFVLVTSASHMPRSMAGGVKLIV